MEWFIGSLLAPLAPRVGRRLTPDLFQGSFVGSSKWFRRRVADGLSHGGGGFAIPSVAASLLPRFTALDGCLSIRRRWSFRRRSCRRRCQDERGVLSPCLSAPLLFPRFPAARGGDRICQNSLSCAPCCAALSLSEQFQFTNLRMRDSAGKGTADERHPAELSSTCGVCRGRRPDRFGALDRSFPRRR